MRHSQSDAESFDYGNGFYGLGERAGVGFKVAVLHPLDIPIIESTAMNIDVGKSWIVNKRPSRHSP